MRGMQFTTDDVSEVRAHLDEGTDRADSLVRQHEVRQRTAKGIVKAEGNCRCGSDCSTPHDVLDPETLLMMERGELEND